MSSIRINDKTFVPYIAENKIKLRVAEVASAISADVKGLNPLFISVLNGSFIFMADLIRGIEGDCEVNFIRYSSYEGMDSTGKVKQMLGLSQSIEGRHVVVVEDIIDSGLTMQTLISTLQAKHPASIRIVTLLVKPNNLKVNLHIDYCCFEIPNDFIVGYGLDYDEKGRNLKDIYVVKE